MVRSHAVLIAVWFALTLFGLACYHAPSNPSAASAALLEIRKDPNGFVQSVATMRDLPLRQRVSFSWDSDEEFARALKNRLKRQGLPATTSNTKGYYLAFGYPLPEQRPASSSPEAVVREQVLGFYDQDASVVHVRNSGLDGEKSADAVLLTLAHEVGHALQHQHFGKIDLRAVQDDERLLTLLAVIEGDAMVTGVSYVAFRHRKSLRRVLTRGAEWVREQDHESLLAADPHAQALRGAPANERDRMLFPYIAGFGFVSDLFRVGGFDMINNTFKAPPATTEQVLHTNKYLAGEQAVPVAFPEPPKGWERGVQGHMGELLIRSLLGQCKPRGSRAPTGEGWGGDAYAVVLSGENQVAVLWSTTWDDEASAERFERALNAGSGCWSGPGKTGKVSIRGTFKVVREGHKVAFVRGLDAEQTEEAIVALLALPGERLPDKPPFGQVFTVPPVPPIPTAEKGRIFGGKYASDMLGVEQILPPEFSVELEGEGLALSLSRSGPSPLMHNFAVSDAPVHETTNEELYAMLVDSVRKQLPHVDLRVTYNGPAKIRLGSGVVREWAMAGSTVRMRAYIVPICDGTGSYVVAQVWTNETGHHRLNEILANLIPTTQRPPVCDDLNP